MSPKFQQVICLAVLLGCTFPVFIHGWGIDGHYIVCKIAQGFRPWTFASTVVKPDHFTTSSRLTCNTTAFYSDPDRFSKSANAAVNDLLPSHAQNDLSSLCSWADKVKFRYKWSSPLHFINTPQVCNYNHKRDCPDEVCVAGAISNYTNQLMTATSAARKSQYNKTEALLFLSHFMGDVHQPLHCSFAADKGGNKINVRWYKRKAVLHHVWDDSIIETALNDYYNSDVGQFVDALKKNITKGDWSDQVTKWEACDKNSVTCPDVYATESITAACEWAYKDATEGTTLGDEYFNSRLPVVNLRLAEAGVRLAATLNRIFG